MELIVLSIICGLALLISIIAYVKARIVYKALFKPVEIEQDLYHYEIINERGKKAQKSINIKEGTDVLESTQIK